MTHSLKRLIAAALIGVLAIIASGCAGDQTKGPNYPVIGTVDQVKMEQAAYAARSTYAGILTIAAEYVALPRCVAGGPTLCSSQSVVNSIRQYSNGADVATKGAVDLARNPTKSASDIINAITDANRAVEVFRNVVAQVKPQAKEVK